MNSTGLYDLCFLLYALRMDHLAIMRREWKLIEKILSGEKTVETRWYKHKSVPWGKIATGDTVYFKDTGQPVTAKAMVSKVEQYENVAESLRQRLLNKYLHSDLGGGGVLPEIDAYTKNKRYCVIVHLVDPQPVKPFTINKKGYGMQAAWIVVPDIRSIVISDAQEYLV